MAFHAFTHQILERKQSYLFTSLSTKFVRYWSHVFTATTDGTHVSNFCRSVQKRYREKERERKKDNCKAFCVTRERNK